NATSNSAATGATEGVGESYVANFAGTAASNMRAIAKTPPQPAGSALEGAAVSVLSPGRRLSRDGNLLAFESVAVFNSDGSLNGALAASTGIYIYNVGANTFTQVSVRPPSDQTDVGLRFPTFTGDSTRVVWVSN